MFIHQKVIDRFGILNSKKSFALNELDFKLAKYLNFKRGFFIEAGANNGLSQSNTLYFEKYMNWKGLLIEPIPELFQKCKVNRKNNLVENCALVPFEYKESHIEMRYCNLMSLVKGAMKTTEEELNHVIKGCKLQRTIETIEPYEVKVPAKTLTSILDRYHISQIDLLSLDVEGYELNALQGINFQRHRPKWMLIESRYRKEIDNFLKPFYEVVVELSHHDVLYKSRIL